MACTVMKLTPEQEKELTELAKPLIKWMNENCHPHTQIVIETNSFQLLEGVIGRQVWDYIKS